MKHKAPTKGIFLSFLALVVVCLCLYLDYWYSVHYINVLTPHGQQQNKIAGVCAMFFFFMFLITSTTFGLFIKGWNKKRKLVPGMNQFESEHKNFSKLYFKHTWHGTTMDAIDVIATMDGKPAVKGFDKNKFFTYIPDKALDTELNIITIPTWITINDKFFKEFYMEPEPIIAGFQHMDFIFLYPNARNILSFDYENMTFDLEHDVTEQRIKQQL